MPLISIYSHQIMRNARILLFLSPNILGERELLFVQKKKKQSKKSLLNLKIELS